MKKYFECHIVKIKNVLKLWKMRDLRIEGKIAIFKTLTFSKTFNNQCTSFYYQAAQYNKKVYLAREKNLNKTLCFTKYRQVSQSKG